MPKKRKPLSKFLKMYYHVANTDNDDVEWKNIDIGDKPMYKISNYGLVKRIDNDYIINPFHSYRKDHDGKPIEERPTYLRVQIYYYENNVRKKTHCEISRLVAKAFIPIPEKYLKLGLTADDLEVNHKVGGYNIYNNSVGNLEWCTTQENIDHAFKNGLRHPKRGESHHSTYITVDDVISICECIKNGLNANDTYIKTGFDKRIKYKKFKPTYYNIKYKNSWKFISQNYF